MLGLTSEVSGLSDRSVILAEWLIQENSGPISLTELCLPDELDASRVDAVDVDAFADDERVRVLREDVRGGGTAIDAGLGQPPCHVLVVKRAAAG